MNHTHIHERDPTRARKQTTRTAPYTDMRQATCRLCYYAYLTSHYADRTGAEKHTPHRGEVYKNTRLRGWEQLRVRRRREDGGDGELGEGCSGGGDGSGSGGSGDGGGSDGVGVEGVGVEGGGIEGDGGATWRGVEGRCSGCGGSSAAAAVAGAAAGRRLVGCWGRLRRRLLRSAAVAPASAPALQRPAHSTRVHGHGVTHTHGHGVTHTHVQRAGVVGYAIGDGLGVGCICLRVDKHAREGEGC
eukprot:5537455-Prymnesium_polylepis.1